MNKLLSRTYYTFIAILLTIFLILCVIEVILIRKNLRDIPASGQRLPHLERRILKTIDWFLVFMIISLFLIFSYFIFYNVVIKNPSEWY